MEGLIALLVLLSTLFGLLLLGREVALWYFKIDTFIKLLTEIRDSLKARR